MRAGVLIFVLLFAALLAAQQKSDTPPAQLDKTNSAEQRTSESERSAPPDRETTSPGKVPVVQPAIQRKGTTRDQAWTVLSDACTSDKSSSRATAISALGLVPESARARKMAEAALDDQDTHVRTAGAVALGKMQARASAPKLRKAADDEDPSVALAAAHALIELKDDSGYDVYYQVLTGGRRGSKGLIATQKAVLKDPKKMAELGVQQGLGFVPFASIGWQAIKTIHQDDATPVRAAAAKMLATDSDPNTTKALMDAAGDKNWLVRTAAIEALAARGDPAALDTVALYMTDEKDAVKYTAAAATLHLIALKEARRPARPRTRAITAEK